MLHRSENAQVTQMWQKIIHVDTNCIVRPGLQDRKTAIRAELTRFLNAAAPQKMLQT